MKSKIIFLTLALAGCGQNIEKTQKTDTEEHYNIKKPVDEFKQERLSTALIPNGRWLVNKRICSKRLMPGEYYDFTINDENITYIGITQSSTWTTADPSLYSERLSIVLEEQASCLTTDIDDFFYTEHISPGNKFVLAVNLDSKLIVRFQNSGDALGSPFDREHLRQFEVIYPEWLEEIEPTVD